MRTNRRGLWLYGLVMAGVAFGIFFLVTAPPRKPLLLERAKPVADANDWVIGFPIANSHAYAMVSDHEAICFRFTDSGHQDEALFSVDFVTGKIKPLPELTALMRRGKPLVEDISEMALSPDGRWLLWQEAGSGGYHVARLDGSAHRHWRAGGATCCWMPDSRHWIAFTAAEPTRRDWQAQIYAVDSPRAMQVVPLAHVTSSPSRCEIAFSHTVTLNVGAAASLQNPMNTTIDLLQLNTAPGLPLLQKSTVPLPPLGSKRDLLQFKLSPDGKRIAWLFSVTQLPPSGTGLPLPFSSKPASPQSGMSLWVSQQDGKGMRQIGDVPLLESLDTTSWDLPSSLQWTPDDKQLSFFYDHHIWLVPADG